MRNIVVCAVVALLASCGDDPAEPQESSPTRMTDLAVPSGFDYGTMRTVAVVLEFRDYHDLPLAGVRFAMYTTGTDTPALVYTGASGSDGNAAVEVSLPSHVTALDLQVCYLGLPPVAPLDVTGASVHALIGGSSVAPSTTPPTAHLCKPRFYPTAPSLSFLGTWDGQGVPAYLSIPDTLSATLLERVNASLPEQRPVPVWHPDYLSAGNLTSIALDDSAEVWVTFVHEGAGYRNALGFSAHPTGQKPATVDDIDSMVVAFPNLSFAGSGGGLRPGDKVRVGVFPAGTTLDWFLIANGWNSSSQMPVYDAGLTFHSNPEFNPELDSLAQHCVALYDSELSLVLIGFEDMRRDRSCDHDFNDAVFYVTSNPPEAIATIGLNPIDRPVDQDHDGVSDVYDDYPSDPLRAFDNYFPSAEGNLTLAFEDEWPSHGDFDLNDMVVDCRVKQVTSAAGQVADIEVRTVLRASGAQYRNGLAIGLGIAPDRVARVTGYDLTDTYIALDFRGLETNQPLATVVVFDNFYNTMSVTPVESVFVNTQPGGTAYAPETVTVSVALSAPVSPSELGAPPYNPFLIVNRNRQREVHLPGHAPTALADTTLFGSGDDRTSSATQRSYVSRLNLPWALALPERWDYPVERTDAVSAFTHLARWAESGGTAATDWYLDRPGYRDWSKVYTATP